MKNPKVSVFMPVYNSEKYLRESIESILGQTMSDFELVIVDDASTDGSYEIIEQYASQDRRIKPYRNRNNTGIAMTCNRAVGRSKGKYVARMDSDDVALKHRLEVQYSFMENNRHLSLAGGWARIMDENGHHIGNFKRPCGWKKINRIVRYTNPLIHPTCFFLRGDFLKVGGYRNFPVSSDYDLLLRMNCAALKIDNVPAYLLYYRVEKTSITQSAGQTQRIAVNAMLELHRERKKRGTDALDEGTVSIEDQMKRHLVEDKQYSKATKRHLQAQQAIAKRSFHEAILNYSAAFYCSRLKREYFLRLFICRIILGLGFVLRWD